MDHLDEEKDARGEEVTQLLWTQLNELKEQNQAQQRMLDSLLEILQQKDEEIFFLHGNVQILRMDSDRQCAPGLISAATLTQRRQGSDLKKEQHDAAVDTPWLQSSQLTTANVVDQIRDDMLALIRQEMDSRSDEAQKK